MSAQITKEEYQNDSFTSLKKKDLITLLNQINHFDLSYRSTLSLEDQVTFGIELEEEGVSLDQVEWFLYQHHIKHWKTDTDGSLKGPSCEIKSPILHDQENDWKQLKKICIFLKKNGAISNRNAGGHLHIGTQILGLNYQYWENFLKLYACYEPVLFRFGYGDKLTPREKLMHYATPRRKVVKQILRELPKGNSDVQLLFSPISNCLLDHRGAIAFGSRTFYTSTPEEGKDKTIEFRFPNATTEEVIWQNNINTFCKMMTSCTQGIDQDFLDYKFAKQEEKGWPSDYADSLIYQEILLKDALEFADLVFDNNLDKYYFLRQYFKGFQVAHGNEKCIYAKSFIKKKQFQKKEP